MTASKIERETAVFPKRIFIVKIVSLGPYWQKKIILYSIIGQADYSSALQKRVVETVLIAQVGH